MTLPSVAASRRSISSSSPLKCCLSTLTPRKVGARFISTSILNQCLENNTRLPQSLTGRKLSGRSQSSIFKLVRRHMSLFRASLFELNLSLGCVGVFGVDSFVRGGFEHTHILSFMWKYLIELYILVIMF